MFDVVRQNANGNRFTLVSMRHIYQLVRTEMSMANPHYRSLPAYSADDAAYIVAAFGCGHHFPTSLGGRALRLPLHGRLLH